MKSDSIIEESRSMGVDKSITASFDLSGWPAAATLISFSLSLVAIIAIFTNSNVSYTA